MICLGWCQVLDWIVQNIFHATPLVDGHDAAKQRAANPNLSFLRIVAIRLNEQGRLNQAISATDIADLCLERDIEIPGLPADNQTVEEGRKQIGRMMGRLFGEATELDFDEFRVVKQEERGSTIAGHTQTLNRYTFSMATSTAQTANPTPNPHTPADGNPL